MTRSFVLDEGISHPSDPNSGSSSGQYRCPSIYTTYLLYSRDHSGIILSSFNSVSIQFADRTCRSGRGRTVGAFTVAADAAVAAAAAAD